MPFQDYDATKQRSCIYLQLSIYSQERGYDTLGTFAQTKCASKTQKSVEFHPLKSPTYSPTIKKRQKSLFFIGGGSVLDPRDCMATLLLSHIHIRTSFDISFITLWSRTDAKCFEPIEKLLSTTFVLPVSLRQPPTTCCESRERMFLRRL